jgi:hypothetical protein
MHRDDQLFLDDASSHMHDEQTELLTKVNRLTIPVRVFSIGSGAFLLVMVAMLIYQKLNPYSSENVDLPHRPKSSLRPRVVAPVTGAEFSSSPTNHDEQHCASYEHDLYQRRPPLYKHISHTNHPFPTNGPKASSPTGGSLLEGAMGKRMLRFHHHCHCPHVSFTAVIGMEALQHCLTGHHCHGLEHYPCL